MVRLVWLRIDRFRNVKPGTELRFGPTFNVLLGKNATGKSTLLDLVAALTNDDLSAYAEELEGFDFSWRLEDEDRALELRASRSPTKVVDLPAELRHNGPFDEEWSIVVSAGGKEASLRVKGGSGEVRSGEKETPFSVRGSLREKAVFTLTLLGAARLGFREGPEAGALLSAALRMLEAGRLVGRLDEGTLEFLALTNSPFRVQRSGNGSLSLPADPRLNAMFELGIMWRGDGDALEVWPASPPGVTHLTDIAALLGFVGVEVQPRLLRRTGDTSDYSGLTFLFRRRDGSVVSHELLSFGQKRFFAFYWHLASRWRFPVVADELLNGLHHEWIDACFERLYERQSFLATQHPSLLDHVPIESAEAVRTTFLRCALAEGPEGREQLVWRNFDEEEAERFYRAYQTGVQHVSEVLRTEGLW